MSLNDYVTIIVRQGPEYAYVDIPIGVWNEFKDDSDYILGHMHLLTKELEKKRNVS